MQTEQKIYGRYEYPLPDNITDIEVRDLLRLHRQSDEIRKQVPQISGYSTAIRHSNPKAIIFLTYDPYTDIMIRLKLTGTDGLITKSYIDY